MTDQLEVREIGLSEDALREVSAIEHSDPDGLIQVETLVERASNPTSALHRYFTWEDAEAAHQYRLDQARALLRRIRIIREDPQIKYVSLSLDTNRGVRRGYLAVDRMVQDEVLFQQAINDALASIGGYRARLSSYSQTRKAVEHLDHAIAALREAVKEESHG